MRLGCGMQGLPPPAAPPPLAVPLMLPCTSSPAAIARRFSVTGTQALRQRRPRAPGRSVSTCKLAQPPPLSALALALQRHRFHVCMLGLRWVAPCSALTQGPLFTAASAAAAPTLAPRLDVDTGRPTMAAPAPAQPGRLELNLLCASGLKNTKMMGELRRSLAAAAATAQVLVAGRCCGRRTVAPPPSRPPPLWPGPPCPPAGRQDPYCVFQIGTLRQKSAVAKDGGTKPSWNQRVDLGQHTPASAPQLLVEVFVEKSGKGAGCPHPACGETPHCAPIAWRPPVGARLCASSSGVTTPARPRARPPQTSCWAA